MLATILANEKASLPLANHIGATQRFTGEVSKEKDKE
jgi:hypothetical protein